MVEKLVVLLVDLMVALVLNWVESTAETWVASIERD